VTVRSISVELGNIFFSTFFSQYKKFVIYNFLMQNLKVFLRYIIKEFVERYMLMLLKRNQLSNEFRVR